MAGMLLAQSDGKNSTGKKSAPPEKVNDVAGRGKRLYDIQCSICHYTATEKQKVGPGLKEIYKRGKFADGRKVEDRSMREWVEKGGKQMPPFKDVLTPREISDLIAYLRTL